MTSSNGELLGRLEGGDADALSELLERHAPAVRQEIARQIPKRWQSVLSADDVVQEMFISAFRAMKTFRSRGESSFRGWLITLARQDLQLALRMLQAQKRGGDRQRIEGATGDDSFVALYERLGGTSSTPSRHAAKNEASGALAAAMQRLPENYRHVVQLYDLECRPVEEVAAVLGRSPGAVYMLRGRAHRRLCELMGTASKYLSGTS